MQQADKVIAERDRGRRRPSAAAHFFEGELAEHRRRQEAKDREFHETLAALELESAARNHSIQVGRKFEVDRWMGRLAVWPLAENR